MNAASADLGGVHAVPHAPWASSERLDSGGDSDFRVGFRDAAIPRDSR